MKYIDTPLVDLDEPEPAPSPPRTLHPRYLDTDPEAPSERPRIPTSAHRLPAYRGTLPFALGGNVHIAPLHTPPPGPLGTLLADAARAFARTVDDVTHHLQPLFVQLRDAALAAQPPDDARAHALWLRQHRNTGPTRDVVHQRRPRRHPGQ